jgi:phosphate transport system substrate-binding protein
MKTATAILLASLGFGLPAAASEGIVLDGSTGMLPLANALAAAYRQKFPDAPVQTGKGLGTGARLRALSEGKIHIALASHGVTADDLRKGDLTVIEIARGAVVFAVNASVAVEGADEQRICDAFGGKTSTWRELGGPDQPIALFTRPPEEVDPEVIRAKVACFKDLREAQSAKVMARGGDMAKALADTPYALGMTSMTVVQQSAGKIRALSLNGAAATEENVRSGRYPLVREFLFVVRAQSAPAVARFIEFVRGPDGERIVRANGAVPVR